jgi:hypothetical protein
LKYVAVILILLAHSVVAVQAAERDSKIAIQTLDLKMRCLMDIAQVNYLILYDPEMSDSEPGYLNDEKEQKFGSFLPHLYSLCGCVIERAVGDLGLAGVKDAMDSNRFWAEVITKYDSATGDSSCPHDPMMDR